jgi:hypothetical protein
MQELVSPVYDLGAVKRGTAVMHKLAVKIGTVCHLPVIQVCHAGSDEAAHGGAHFCMTILQHITQSYF